MALRALTRSLPRPLARPLARAAAALSWPAPVDDYVRLVRPLYSSAGHRARVERVVPETPRATTLVLRPDRGFPRHRPGQWVGLGVDIDGVRHRRCYSLTSVPGRPDGCVSITVQAVPGGTVSPHLARNTAVGDVVHLDAPSGDFVLPAPVGPPLLFITGGSGLTPVMGMLRSMVADRSLPEVTLLHHAPRAAEVLFADELAELADRFRGLRVEVALTGDGPPPAELALTTDRLDALCPDWRSRDAWVCGPAPLLEAADALWSDPHVGGTLHVERFTAATAVVPSEATGGTVHFARSGVRADTDGTRTLLEVAESAGLAPRSGCRMGVCHRCVTPLSTGVVHDRRDGRLHTDPGTHVQICVSSAVGDVTLEL